MKITIQSLILVASMFASSGVILAADASETWAKSCASCHGKDGSGDTTMGKKNNVANYQDAAVQAKFTDDQAFETIKNGKEKMKAYKEKLTDEEIKGLVAYIRTFKK